MKALLLPLLLVSFQTLANEKGNGGDVVLCENRRPVMLDVFEVHGTPDAYDLGKAETPYRELVERAIQRVEAFSPEQGRIYRERAQVLMADIDALMAAIENPQDKVREARFTFTANTVFTTDVLVDVPDSLHLTYPRGCRVEQLAVQFPSTEGRYNRFRRLFIVDKGLLLQLDSVSLASFVMHEAIYKDFVGVPDADSVGVREFNGVLSGPQWPAQDRAALEALYRRVQLERYLPVPAAP